jgi:hypothetical protein
VEQREGGREWARGREREGGRETGSEKASEQGGSWGTEQEGKKEILRGGKEPDRGQRGEKERGQRVTMFERRT